MVVKRFDTSTLIDPFLLGLDVTKQSAGNEVVVRCPYHDDTHPSSSFNVVSGLFFCFACGASANAITLAKLLGGRVERRGITKEMAALHFSYDMPEWRKWFSSSLANDNEYLQSRGVTEKQVFTYSIRELNWGVAFPMYSRFDTGQGILVRRTDSQSPKYLFFGLKPSVYFSHCHDTETITLVEGIFGMLAADRAKVFAATTLGTAIQSAELVAQFHVAQRQVQILFDNDFAGYMGAARALRALPLARVIVPGQEADELNEQEWQAISNGDILTTGNLSILSHLSRDPSRFNHLLKRIYN